VSLRREDGVERFTYRELDRLSLRAAAFLRGAGLAPGDRCAILAENSARWIAAYLGILRLGAVAVPFDTAYKSQQVSTLLRDSGATLLFASARLEAVAREAAGPVRVAPLTFECDAPHAGLERCPAAAADAAVILYTSGTTADPKGVVLTHANLLAEKEGAFQVVPVSERDVVLGVLPLFHALAQMANLLLPFLLGAHVVFLDTLSSRELLRALDEEGITVFVCVPQFFYLIHQRVIGEVEKRGVVARRLFRAMMRTSGALRRAGIEVGPLLFARAHRTLGRRMRLLVTGGSKFDEAIGWDMYALGFTMVQAYGLTETSGAATVTRHSEPIDTVGEPLPGVEVRIVGLLPEGGSHSRENDQGGFRLQAEEGLEAEQADGEIVIRGPIVMAGYWNNPAATAAVLRDGWLHTGDLGRLDARGRLTITGRSKEVIVLSSGKNIYPEEIEAHYRQSPFIKELCVLGITAPGEPSAERLHAIVVPDLDVLRERKIVNTSELIRFELEGLSVSVPAHKRVLGFDISMEPLPRTTTGKLKRHEVKKWREMSHARTEVRSDGSAVDPPVLEPHVARVVELVRLAVRPGVVVRPDSNLELDLGLDSMERVELLASLEQRFGIRVAQDVAQTVFLVSDLAEAFRGATERGARAELQWATLLEASSPGPELPGLLRPRRIVAPLLFVIARVLVRLLARPRVEGLDRFPCTGPFIISPNHQSYLDPFVLVGVLPYRVFRQLFFVGAAEYFETRLTAWLARNLNVVPVDPDANLLPAMQAGAFGLRHGKVLVLFPEGERSIDGGVKKFKKGAAILSRHLGAPVVPIAVDGVFEIWGRNRRLNWHKLLPWSGHRVRLRVGDAVAPQDGESYAAQTARVRAAVDEMWNELNSSGSRTA
jgi:long-chain acyl-CoA synthetase